MPTGASCGGQPTLVSDGSTWTCSFDSEFTGTSLDTKQWTPITTAGSGYISGLTACFVNSPNNISVGNGYLSLTARKESAPFYCKMPVGGFITQYTSGTISTYGLFSQTYGRFDVRAKVPAATIAGLQSSFWLVPQNETVRGIAARRNRHRGDLQRVPDTGHPHHPLQLRPGHHQRPRPIPTWSPITPAPSNPAQFNDYVVEWTPTTISMIYNGKTCLVDHWIPSAPLTGNQPFNQPFFINLTQALGVWTNNFNPWITPLPATTEIQYVRGWKLDS